MDDRLPRLTEQYAIDVDNIDDRLIDAGQGKRVYLVEATDGSKYAIYRYRDRSSVVGLGDIAVRTKAEAHSFETIRTETALNAPAVVGTDGDGHLICEFVAGENLGLALEDGPDRADGIARLLGDALSMIHEVRYEHPGYLRRTGVVAAFETWRSYIESVLDRAATVANDDPLVRKGLRRLRDDITLLDGCAPAALVHGDFHPWNTLVDDDGTLIVLDCEGSLAGDPAYDLSLCLSTWGSDYGVTDAFLDGYDREALSTQWQARLDFYEMFHATIGAVNAMVADTAMASGKRARLTKALR